LWQDFGEPTVRCLTERNISADESGAAATGERVRKKGEERSSQGEDDTTGANDSLRACSNTCRKGSVPNKNAG